MENFNENSMRNLIEEATSKDLKNKMLYFGVIEHILRNMLFDPTECLALTIPFIKTIGDFGLIKICMDNGAKKNFYVKSDTGRKHILIYAYSNVQDQELRNMVLVILLMSGCDPQSPSTKMKGSSAISETVSNWFKVYEDLEIPIVSEGWEEMISNFSEEQILAIDIYFSRKVEYSKYDIPVMCCFRVALFDKITDSPNASNAFKLSFFCAFEELFMQILNSKHLPSYSDISFFISHFSRISSKPLSSICSETIKRILLEIVRRGCEIDIIQLNELENIDSIFKLKMRDTYMLAPWEKLSYNIEDGNVPIEYRQISTLFGCAPDAKKNIICKLFKDLSSSDISELAEIFRTKNRQRFELETCNVIEKNAYLHSNSIDAIDYPPLLWISYVDKKGNKWMFLSSSFEIIVRERKNPRNQRRIPEYFTLEVQSRINLLKSFGIILSDPHTYSDLLKKIKQPSKLSRDYIDGLERIYGSELRSKGYNKSNLMNANFSTLSTNFEEIDIQFDSIVSVGEISNFSETRLGEDFVYSLLLNCIHTSNSKLEKLKSL